MALDERDLLRIGIFAAALPLLAMIAGLCRRVRLTAGHQVWPVRLDPGTRGQVVLSVTNSGGTRTAALQISEPATTDLTPGVRCLLPPLRPGHQARTDYPLLALRRGRFLLGPPSVRIGDPLGLWEDNRTLAVRSEVIVVPTVVDLAGMPISTGTRSAAADRAMSGAGGGDPDVGIRFYRSGDDIRTIHWRASARHDELMVRLDEPVSHGGAIVMLDHRARFHAGTGTNASLDTAVTLAASISLHLLTAEHQMRLTTHTGAVLANGRDIADDLLAALAVVEPDPTGNLTAGSVAGTGMVIVVLGAIDVPSARLLIAARRRSTNAIAFVLATGEWAAAEEAAAERPGRQASAGGVAPNVRPVEDAAAVALLQSTGWRVITVHRGDSLAVAWSRACAGSAAYQRSADRHVPLPARS